MITPAGQQPVQCCRHVRACRPGRQLEPAGRAPGEVKRRRARPAHGITLRGVGNSLNGTVIKPQASPPNNLCTRIFGPTGVCILAKQVNKKTGKVISPVYDDTVTGLYVKNFASNGVFGYGTYGLTVQRVVAVQRW